MSPTLDIGCYKARTVPDGTPMAAADGCRLTTDPDGLQDEFLGRTTESLKRRWWHIPGVAVLGFVLTILFAANLGCSEQSPSKDVPALPAQTSYKELLADHTKKLVATWSFPGTEMGPAEMYFWDNGLLVIDSEIFSSKKSEHYLLWSLNKSQTLLLIMFVDDRIPFKDIVAQVENSHLGKHVHSININSRTVNYIVSDRRAVFFLNWRFAGEPIRKSN